MSVGGGVAWPRGRTTASGGAGLLALGAKLTKRGNGFGEENRGRGGCLCGDEGGRSAVAGSLVWEKTLGKMGCVWGVFVCVAGKEKWSCGLGEGERPWLRGRRFCSCEGKKGVGFVFQRSGGLENLNEKGV